MKKFNHVDDQIALPNGFSYAMVPLCAVALMAGQVALGALAAALWVGCKIMVAARKETVRVERSEANAALQEAYQVGLVNQHNEP